MLVSCEEMRAIEERAFAGGSSAEALMEEAGWQIAMAVRQFFAEPGCALIFFGKGHNGGDALVAARHLASAGWDVIRQPAFAEKDWAELTAKKNRELPVRDAPRARPLVILDGLLGIGASGGLRDPIRAAAQEINRLRIEENAYVFAIDVPTGVDAGTGQPDEDAVIADFTLTIGCCKTGLVADRATSFVGRLAVLPVSKLTSPGGDDVITPQTLSGLKPRRAFDSHKNQFGRVGIVAGSMGLTGAAILAAEGALRAGAGLVRLFVSPDVHPIIAASAAPEIMVQAVEDFSAVREMKFDVLAIGPGLGNRHRDEALDLIRNVEQPMVIDADGLNILASSLDALHESRGPRLLTPHPGEMRRLMKTDGMSRQEVAGSFTNEWPVTLLFKGSRTIVGERGRPMSYNTTGNPGMCTGGIGDVLTGVCAALIGQGLTPYDAAKAGAWACGRAAEIAIFEKGRSEESLIASDIIDQLGAAFSALRTGCF